jgi:hypothetical protein
MTNRPLDVDWRQFDDCPGIAPINYTLWCEECGTPIGGCYQPVGHDSKHVWKVVSGNALDYCSRCGTRLLAPWRPCPYCWNKSFACAAREKYGGLG